MVEMPRSPPQQNKLNPGINNNAYDACFVEILYWRTSQGACNEFNIIPMILNHQRKYNNFSTKNPKHTISIAKPKLNSIWIASKTKEKNLFCSDCH